MTSDIGESRAILSPSDVCMLLRIKESTLRKYALLLQEAGYHFDSNEKGQRAYYERDVISLKKLLEIKKSPDMTLEQSANAVVTWFNQSNMSLSAIPNDRYNKHYDSDMKELKEIVNQQNIMILEIMKKMDQQQKYIDERMEERDRKLMESIRQSQEERKALLQIAAAAQEEKKKGFLARIFGK
jgi:hypothetical protein